MYEEILDRVVRYLVGEMTLDELEEWFVPATWDVESSGDEATQRLVHNILSLLTELSTGDLTRSEFDNHLRESVRNISLSYPATTGNESYVSSEAETINVLVPIQSWSVVGGTLAEVGSG